MDQDLEGKTKRTTTIMVNGDPMEIISGLTVAQLVQQVRLKPELVVVELNLNILKREELPSTVLKEGDQVEIVHFVGGGSDLSFNVSEANAWVRDSQARSPAPAWRASLGEGPRSPFAEGEGHHARSGHPTACSPRTPRLASSQYLTIEAGAKQNPCAGWTGSAPSRGRAGMVPPRASRLGRARPRVGARNVSLGHSERCVAGTPKAGMSDVYQMRAEWE